MFFTFISLNAQTFEIRTHYSSGSSFTVDMRCTSDPHPTTNNYILDIVFGIKWLNSYNTDLGNVSGNYNISKSDVEKVKNEYEFQAFYANNCPYNFPEDWTLNVWRTIATIPVNNGSGSGTFEITEVGFDETTDLNINIDGVDYTPTINGSANGIPLLITLLNFKVEKENSISSLLNWTFTSDIDINRFEIERSPDSRTWKCIGKVNPFAFQRSNDYSYVDKNVYNGDGEKTFYYRLKTIDINGMFAYSEIRSVIFNSKNIELTLFPNPSSEKVYFSLNGITQKQYFNITIFDTSGKLVFNKNMEYKNKTTLLMDNTITGLKSGIYNIIIKDDNNNRRFYKKLLLAK